MGTGHSGPRPESALLRELRREAAGARQVVVPRRCPALRAVAAACPLPSLHRLLSGPLRGWSGWGETRVAATPGGCWLCFHLLRVGGVRPCPTVPPPPPALGASGVRAWLPVSSPTFKKPHLRRPRPSARPGVARSLLSTGGCAPWRCGCCWQDSVASPGPAPCTRLPLSGRPSGCEPDKRGLYSVFSRARQQVRRRWGRAGGLSSQPHVSLPWAWPPHLGPLARATALSGVGCREAGCAVSASACGAPAAQRRVREGFAAGGVRVSAWSSAG